MSEDDKIDFRALDPSTDAVTWSLRVAEVAERGRARARRRSVPRQLRAWARPTLVLAAALAAAVWAGAFLAGPRDADATEPAYVVAQWAANEARPSPRQILEVLGDDDGVR
jgi:hypothetical protein